MMTLLMLLFITMHVYCQTTETTMAPNNSSAKPINRTRNMVLCDIREALSGNLLSSCDLASFNFTFYAYFRPKRAVRLKDLKHLSSVLSYHSTCDIKYMRYNFFTESLEYFYSGDDYYWYEGKKLNDTYKPDVYIVSDSVRRNRKKIIFECRLPKSDVQLSLNPVASRSSHSHPLPPKKVTVSALHVRLDFVPIEGININLDRKQTDTATTTSEYPTPYDQTRTSGGGKRSSVERYIIFYANKCRNCSLNVENSTVDGDDELFKPTFKRSIKCHLKPDTCVHDGQCYADKERSKPGYFQQQNSSDSQFVCNTKYSQTPLLFYSQQPCWRNNGDCGRPPMFDCGDCRLSVRGFVVVDRLVREPIESFSFQIIRERELQLLLIPTFLLSKTTTR